MAHFLWKEKERNLADYETQFEESMQYAACGSDDGISAVSNPAGDGAGQKALAEEETGQGLCDQIDPYRVRRF